MCKKFFVRYLESWGSIYTLQKTFENGKLNLLPTPPSVSRFRQDGLRFRALARVNAAGAGHDSRTDITGFRCGIRRMVDGDGRQRASGASNA